MDLYPLKFHPILKERVWGGRRLEQLYGKPLPPGVPIGESWEVSDRPEDTSVVANGHLAGADLHSVLDSWGSALLGRSRLLHGQFPLLIKILDAQEKLSLQVHPPSETAARLAGEPKTEMWYIAHAEPGAELYVGLKEGTTRAQFEEGLLAGTVERCFHRVVVRSGDTMFLPSGRVHAIGAGLVIFEIQQNSDTTYRVFDWNRIGLDGKPRQLHIPESLASIDFHDFAPGLIVPKPVSGPQKRYNLVSDRLFRVDLLKLEQGEDLCLEPGRMWIIGMVKGGLRLEGDFEAVPITAGQFSLVSAGLRQVVLRGTEAAELLLVAAGAE